MKISNLKQLRALSTDVAPNEIPVIFSQAFFLLRYAGRGVAKDPVAKQLIEGGKKFTIPYNYEARLAGGKFRDLCLMHPFSQVSSARFLQEYGPALSERCLGSSFSVRYPSRVRPWKQFWSKSSDGGSRELSPSSFPPYFMNERFLRLYKFLASDEFLDLERQFPLMMELDIRKCFYSIYTHSVTWAITDKHYAKDSFKKKPYEDGLDKLFQKMNFNETNGIIVGPEFSRVFAELVLQDIDVRVEKKLEGQGLEKGRDYAIRRYVDNYYIFSSSPAVLSQARNWLESSLKDYKLYLNESKTETYSRPFINAQGRLGQSLSELINSFFEDLVVVTSEAEFVSRTVGAMRSVSESFLAARFVQDIQSNSQLYQIRLARDRRMSAKDFIGRYRKLVSDYEFETGEGASQILGSIRRLLKRVEGAYVSHVSRVDQAYAEQSFARDIGTIIHYFCSSSPSFTSVDFGIDCLIRARSICGAGSNLKGDFAENLWRLFYDIFYAELGAIDPTKATSLEFACFLSVLPTFEKHSLVTEEELLHVWEILESEREDTRVFPYWEAMCILFYSNRGNAFRKVKARILAEFWRVLKKPGSEIRADVSLAFLDLVRYPGFSRLCRKSIYRHLCKRFHISPANVALNDIILSKEPWFIDWSQDFDIRARLNARRLQAAY